MESKFNLSSSKIEKIGVSLSNNLQEVGVRNASLVIRLSDKEFKKVDDDLFYRNKKSDDSEYVPSDDEILVSFDNVNVVIQKKGVDK